MNNASQSAEERIGWKFWLGLSAAMAMAIVVSYFTVTAILGATRGDGGPSHFEGDMRAHIERLGQTDAVVISRKGCPACKAAKEWVAAEHRTLVFVEIDDSKDAEGVLRTLGARGVPTLLVKNEAITGFDPGEWDRLLSQ